MQKLNLIVTNSLSSHHSRYEILKDSLIPKIRFPEFNSRWEKTKAGNVCDSIVPGRNKPTRFDGEIPWITLPDLKGRLFVSKSIANLKLHKEDIKVIGTKVIPEGSVIMSCIGELGVSAITTRDVVVNQQLHAFLPSNLINNVFLKYVIENQKKYFYRHATKTSVLYLNKDNCNSLPLFVPDIVEQQLITDFIKSVDKKISLLKEKQALLEQYKKGVMQKLFSQDIRFKDKNGNDFPDWSKGTLGDLSDKVSNKNKDESVTAVLTNSAKSGIVNQTDYFKKNIANENNLGGYSIVEKDDFVYNPRISVLAPVGPIKRNHVGQGVMSPLYNVFRFKDEKILDYLELYFETTQWHRYMNTIANFGARHDRMNITMGDFFNLPISIPSQYEMQKIVGFIQALNKKVNAVAQQIEHSQTFKKGLLQQMFV